MSYKSLYTLALICLTLQSEASIWTDQNGRAVEAELRKTTGNGASSTVVFKKDNGMFYQFPLKDLAVVNQQEIAELTASTKPEANTSAALQVIEKTASQ
jgi:hypothetical protein